MRFLLTVALSILTAGAAAAAQRTSEAVWSAKDVAACRRGSTVGPAAAGGLTLIDRDLLQHETGATVHAPDRRGVREIVTDMVWIKTEFVLDVPTARGAVLCFCHGVVKSSKPREMIVTVNGVIAPYKRVHTRARPYSGVYPKDKFPKGHGMHGMNGKPYKSWWEGGWERVTVDPKLLRKGKNAVVIRARKGGAYSFLIEQSLYPNRSAVSRDGGQTWDYDRLSANENLNGEYIVRLLLRRHPATGWIEGEPADLWPRGKVGAIATPAQILGVKLTPTVAAPNGAAVKLLARLGPTPEYDPATWTAWRDASELARGKAGGAALARGNYRFVQWRAELSASGDRMSAPRLSGVRVSAAVVPKSFQPAMVVASCEIEQPSMVRPSHKFVHAKLTRRLKLLREHCKLDDVVKGKARGHEQLAAIAVWVRSLRLGNKGGSLEIDTPWDALLFWHTAKTGLTARMCTHRGAFFVQCATALGYTARPLIWSHAIAEAWADDLGRWVAYDPSGGFYFEKDGRPTSMLDVAMTWKRSDKHKVRTVRASGRKSGRMNDRSLAWHTRFFMPMRSNYLESPEPSEHGHGKYSFKYDGHLRWLHPKREPFPWFAFTTSRDGDVLFTVNTVNLHLARAPETDTLSVMIETDAPNLARFEARSGKGAWGAVERVFTWQLSPGKNALAVRAVNTFGLPGRISRAEVMVRK